jgi:uncharacterized membrane protein YidH (DUF202 family)
MTEDQVDRAGREAAFRADVAAMKVRGGSVARERTLARLGVALLVVGVLLGGLAYLLSSGTDNPLQQRDAIVVALAGVAVAIAGSAVFLRYSLGALLRLWLARQVLDRE